MKRGIYLTIPGEIDISKIFKTKQKKYEEIKPPKTTKLFIPFVIECYKAIADGSKAHKKCYSE